MKEIQVEKELKINENKTQELMQSIKKFPVEEVRNQQHPEMYVDRDFCQRAMDYEIEEYWEIWPEETLKFNSENPKNATLGKPSKFNR